MIKRANLKEVGTQIPIPTTYEQYSLEEFAYWVLESTEDSTLYEMQLKKMEDLYQMNGNKVFWVDTLNHNNFIAVFYGNELGRINWSAQNAKLMLAILKKNVRVSDTTFIQQVDYLQETRGRGSKYDYLKIKTKQQTLLGERYLTMYAISTHKHTFMVSVANTAAEDYQQLINNLRVEYSPQFKQN